MSKRSSILYHENCKSTEYVRAYADHKDLDKAISIFPGAGVKDIREIHLCNR